MHQTARAGLKMVYGCLAFIQTAKGPKMALNINRKWARCTTWFRTSRAAACKTRCNDASIVAGSLASGIAGNSAYFADNSRSCRHFLWIFWVVVYLTGVATNNVPIRITIRIQEF